MAVLHIVLLKFKPEATTSERHDILQDINTLSAIPCVRGIQFGENFTQRSQGYTHALVVQLEQKEDVMAYAVHPLHQAFVARLSPLTESLLAVDFENESAAPAASI
ncbi:stress responsive A/B barrel domain-containing protein [Syncephalis fuscata]|nr:stress responsive A/B barrel domain-containing protein [Syncephalis fuscata]